MEAPDWEPIDRTLSIMAWLGSVICIPIAILAGWKLAELLLLFYRAW